MHSQFSIKYKFCTKRLSNCPKAVFIKIFYIFSQTDHFLRFPSIIKEVTTKKKVFNLFRYLETFPKFRTISLHRK